MTDDEKLTDDQKLPLQRLQEIVRKQEELIAEADKINDPRKRREFLLAGVSEIIKISAAILAEIKEGLGEKEPE